MCFQADGYVQGPERVTDGHNKACCYRNMTRFWYACVYGYVGDGVNAECIVRLTVILMFLWLQADGLVVR